VLEKMGIQYRCKELEIRNNLPYRNFSRFEIEFEIKIQRASMNWISLENSLENLGTLDLMKFGQKGPCYTLLPGKINFYQKGIRNLISTQKRSLDWFYDSLSTKLYFKNPPSDLGS
jgi:hypothetical protein